MMLFLKVSYYVKLSLNFLPAPTEGIYDVPIYLESLGMHLILLTAEITATLAAITVTTTATTKTNIKQGIKLMTEQFSFQN